MPVEQKTDDQRWLPSAPTTLPGVYHLQQRWLVDGVDDWRDIEVWTLDPGLASAVVTGRTPIPLVRKINPLWWFGNDAEQSLNGAPWYMPGKPYWRRWLFWQFRNPFQNFRAFVLGVQDRNYAVSGKRPVLTVQRNDLDPPETGWQWCSLKLTVPRPFVSYSGKHFVFYAGWQPNGFAGLKLNFRL